MQWQKYFYNESEVHEEEPQYNRHRTQSDLVDLRHILIKGKRMILKDWRKSVHLSRSETVALNALMDDYSIFIRPADNSSRAVVFDCGESIRQIRTVMA